MRTEVLLLLGVIRIAFWLTGIYTGYLVRRILPRTGTTLMTGFSLAALGSLVFTFSNAGFDVDQGLQDAAATVATPAAALIVTGTYLLTLFIHETNKRARRRHGPSS